MSCHLFLFFLLLRVAIVLLSLYRKGLRTCCGKQPPAKFGGSTNVVLPCMGLKPGNRRIVQLHSFEKNLFHFFSRTFRESSSKKGVYIFNKVCVFTANK
jgi:hypothetical protein